MNTTSSSADTTSWLIRHEFLLRRLHSLSGLIPVGAYMVIHLATNASVLNSAASFQNNVYSIHSLGKLLPLIEWGFIFLPLIFHAVFGVVIVRSGMLNYGSYPTNENARYSLQRISGMIAFLFIFWHVFHMHGWFHSEAWLSNVADPLGGAKFRPYNAATSLAIAMSGFFVPALYLIGVLACVFHLANGIWTMGITWGVWVSPKAQQRANWVCSAFGLGLAVVAISALTGAKTVPVKESLQAEQEMFKAKVDSQLVQPDHLDHKRWSEEELATIVKDAIERESSADQPIDDQQPTNDTAAAPGGLAPDHGTPKRDVTVPTASVQ